MLPVIYLGDSHVKYLKQAQLHHLLLPRKFDGCEVGGATAVGMRNPNAMTNAIGRFRDWVKDKPRDSIVIVHLGEVDCGYVIWYRQIKYAETIEAQLGQSVDAYFEFVDELLGSGFSRVVITGATLPTITDTDQLGEVVQKRSNITATQRERTDLTLLYNDRLMQQAARRGLLYAEVTDDVLDPATRLVHTSFRNKDPADHHMNYEPAAVVWAQRINACLEQCDPKNSPVRRWVAASACVARALTGDPGLLAPGHKLPVEKGDYLEARLDAETEGLLAISDACLNGEPLPRSIRLIDKASWQPV